MKTRVWCVAFLLYLSSSTTWAQMTQCIVTTDASTFNFNYEICHSGAPATYVVEASPTIFHTVLQQLVPVAVDGCSPGVVSNPYPGGIYGRQVVNVRIYDQADPATDLATCSGTHIHARSAAIELVLDKSGSMKRSGKFGALQTATNVFVDTISPVVEIRPGIMQNQYYGITFYNQMWSYLNAAPAGDVDYEVPGEPLNTNVKDAINLVMPGGWTSIGGGLQSARMALEVNIPTVPVNNDEQVRPAILLFSDGLENAPPMIAAEEPLLTAQGIPVYSIGFGNDFEIDAVKLQNLSTATGGVYRHTTDPLDITQYFMKALVDNYADTDMILDPKGTIDPGKKDKIDIPVSEYDKAIIVVLTWSDKAADIGLEIKASGLKVDEDDYPSTAKIVNAANYKVYALRVCQEAGEKKCGKPGTWKATLRGDKNLTQRYSLGVLTRSSAHMAVSVPAYPVTTGQSLPIAAQLFVKGKRKSGVKANAKISFPSENVFSRIARHKKPARKTGKSNHGGDALNRVRQRGRSLYAKGGPARKSANVVLSQKSQGKRRGKPGANKSTFKQTRHPGSYDVVVRGEWKTPKGYLLVRESVYTVNVAATPGSKSKIKTKLLSNNRKAGIKKIRVAFTPKDRFGDLIGIGHADDIKLCSQECYLGGFVDQGNGTYSKDVDVPVDWRSLRLTMRSKSFRVSLRGGRK